MIETEEECPDCGGAGYVDYDEEGEYEACHTCDGEGVVRRIEDDE